MSINTPKPTIQPKCSIRQIVVFRYDLVMAIIPDAKNTKAPKTA